MFDEARDDFRDERLEPFVVAVFLGVDDAVPVDDPAHVAEPVIAQDERFGVAPARRVAERGAQGVHGFEYAALRAGGSGWRSATVASELALRAARMLRPAAESAKDWRRSLPGAVVTRPRFLKARRIRLSWPGPGRGRFADLSGGGIGRGARARRGRAFR